jgi:hypothetical protein
MATAFPLASLWTTYFVGLSAMRHGSHWPDPIASPVNFKLQHYRRLCPSMLGRIPQSNGRAEHKQQMDQQIPIWLNIRQ